MLDIEAFQIGQALPAWFSVTDTHERYTMMFPTWQKNRAAREGSLSIKRGRDVYLPKLESQAGQDKAAKDDYNDYLDRANWYAATGQTVNAFIGMMFKKQPQYTFVNLDGGDFVEDDIYLTASQGGENFTTMMKKVADEVLTVNRVGLLEDYPTASDTTLTLLEAQNSGMHSYTAIYKAEDILNWGTEKINGIEKPVWYVVRELYQDTTNSYTNPVNKYRYRILAISPDTGYIQIVVSDKGGTLYVDNLIQPLVNGAPLDYIPFWVLSVYGDTPMDVHAPEINDLVEVNLGHYRNSADYERELHKMAIKSLVLPGIDPEMMKQSPPMMGGAFCVPAESKPYMLEASNMSGIADEMRRKEERMAVLGSQILATKGRYVEAAQTAQIQAEGESSIVGSMAASLEKAMSDLLTLKIKWSLGLQDEQAAVKLNTDYYGNGLTPADVQYLVQAMQSGGLSMEAYFYQLQRAGMYPEGWTFEDEMASIQNSGGGAFSELQSQIDDLKAARQAQTVEDNQEPVTNADGE
jgi:hypothetical protein